jgi:hypothetical protein
MKVAAVDKAAAVSETVPLGLAGQAIADPRASA